MTDAQPRRLVGPNDDPLEPVWPCLDCGARYFDPDAASDCCTSAATDDIREIEVCPSCGSSKVRCVSSRSMQRDEPLPSNHCAHCGERFDEPATRRDSVPNGLKGLAKRLAESEPDAVGRDV